MASARAVVTLLPFDMLAMMSPVAFSPAAPAGRSVTAPLQSAPSMGFSKAELAGAHGRRTLRTPELLPSQATSDISKGSKSEGRQGRSGINWEGRYSARRATRNIDEWN